MKHSKKIKFPTAQTILLIIAAITALLTWVIPSGKFDTLTYDKAENHFIRNSIDKTVTLEATQETLNALENK